MSTDCETQTALNSSSVSSAEACEAMTHTMSCAVGCWQPCKMVSAVLICCSVAMGLILKTWNAGNSRLLESLKRRLEPRHRSS